MENTTKHKCFISFKTQDIEYKKYIQEQLDIDMIDKSLNEPIQSEDEDYIMRKIREDYLSDSTVTICLIGTQSAENSPNVDQTYIKRELQASLYNGKNNTRNGILGVVLHSIVKINCDTTIYEFCYNYYLPKPSDKCAWKEDDRYCVLVKWEDFCIDPEQYIEKAFQKRTSPIAEKVQVYPK